MGSQTQGSRIQGGFPVLLSVNPLKNYKKLQQKTRG